MRLPQRQVLPLSRIVLCDRNVLELAASRVVSSPSFNGKSYIMSRVLALFACGVICVSLSGCGGGNAEIKPTASAPKVDPAVLEAKRKESMEKGKQMMPGNAPAK